MMGDFNHFSVLWLQKNTLYVCSFKTLDKMTTITHLPTQELATDLYVI